MAARGKDDNLENLARWGDWRGMGSVRSRSVVVTLAAAGAVVVLALAGALLLRPRPSTTATVNRPPLTVTSSAADQPVQCDNGPCQLLAATTAGDSTVQLYADTADPNQPNAQQSGRVRFAGQTGPITFETNISQDEAVLTRSSLSCLPNPAAAPACIVFGEYSQDNQKDGSLAEVFVERGGYWVRPSYDIYYSSAGYFTLWPGGPGTAPQVITVQNQCAGDDDQCPSPKVYVQMFALGVDSPTGCTKPVSAISLLPGHGTVLPPASDLKACPKSAG
jgi:hypothetical protein